MVIHNTSIEFTASYTISAPYVKASGYCELRLPLLSL